LEECDRGRRLGLAKGNWQAVRREAEVIGMKWGRGDSPGEEEKKQKKDKKPTGKTKSEKSGWRQVFGGGGAAVKGSGARRAGCD
jgi:hypothetical protein